MKDSDAVTVTANEIAMPYRGFGFNGAYVGANIDVNSVSSTYLQKNNQSFTSSYTFNNDGSATVDFKSNKGRAIDSYEGTKDAGVLFFNKTSVVVYGEKWIYGHYSSAAKTSLHDPDAMVAYEIPSGSYSDYIYKYLAVKLPTSTDVNADYVLVEIWHKNTSTFVDCAVLNWDCDVKNGEYAPMYAYLNDITFEFTDGSTSVVLVLLNKMVLQYLT